MSQPYDHHFIPVFYLKRWTDKGLLYEFKKVCTGRIVNRRVGPKGTGFERHLYTFDDLPGETAQWLEAAFLKGTDHLASQALQKLLAGDHSPWSVELRSAWSRFVFQLLMRHPHPFSEIRAAATENWLRADADTHREYERLRTPDMPATFDGYIDQQPELAARMRVDLIKSALDNDRLGVRINKLMWEVIDVSNARYPLLTSDWPLENRLGSPNRFVPLPISPRHLFIGAHEPATIRALRSQRVDDLVRTVNRYVVTRARLYVYASDTSQRRFIENWMSREMDRSPFFPTIRRALFAVRRA
jgi:hypothetical protein